jgi:uncharacterized membrane protein YbhN (UPF0104 family)
MNPKDSLMKRKKHLIFPGLFLLVLAFNVTVALMAGQTFLGATWKAISDIRPMDYLMFALFWYSCAVHRPIDAWGSSLIALNLFWSNNQK